MKADKITTTEFKNMQEAASALAAKNASVFMNTFNVTYDDYTKLKITIEEKQDNGEFISCVVTIEVFDNFFKKG